MNFYNHNATRLLCKLKRQTIFKSLKHCSKRNCHKTLINTAFKVVTYVDSLDWKDYGDESIVNTVPGNKHLGNGSIILCHNGAKFTKDALDNMIAGLEDKGFPGFYIRWESDGHCS